MNDRMSLAFTKNRPEITFILLENIPPGGLAQMPRKSNAGGGKSR
jgi:hypothetical protein